MLYRTHHPLFFHHFTPTPTTRPPHISLPLQVEQGMECVEGALKSSFMPEMTVKKTHQHQQAGGLLDDLWTTVNTQNDDFFVDDLLDFSKDEFFEEAEDQEETEHEKEETVKNKEVKEETVKNKEVKEETMKNNNNNKDSSSDPCTELTIPAEDMADLEWLSHFVEDSFSEEYSLTCPVNKLPTKPAAEPALPVQKQSTFATPVQTKARSKRARTGFRVWSLGSSSLTESSSAATSSSSSTSSTTHSNPWLIYTSPSQTADSFLRLPPPAAKKPKKRKQVLGAGSSAGAGTPQQQPRRCTHCLVQKTPQWRAGPLGPKTLCNACGVRFKSGRLLPEYRPACSPTFSSEVHSNNHRKVLEMRRQKETVPELTQPVQSFESKILVG